jgi:hypothetical protein
VYGRPPGWARLPDWAKELSNEYQRYTFARCEVFRGAAVAAVRSVAGAGPMVVITDSEAEMRTALGVPDGIGLLARRLSPSCWVLRHILVHEEP